MKNFMEKNIFTLYINLTFKSKFIGSGYKHNVKNKNTFKADVINFTSVFLYKNRAYILLCKYTY